MRILVVGASGVIGSAVVGALGERGHAVLQASRNGEIKVDMDDPVSIRAMYASVGKVDVVVVCTGSGVF